MVPIFMADRAIVFIDGNNWYHSLKDCGVARLGDLSYSKISEKLVGPARQWLATRYYIGRVNQGAEPVMYAAQRRFLSALEKDSRITAHFGRLEPHRVKNELSIKLLEYLANISQPLDPVVRRELKFLAQQHAQETIVSEKAVDVKIAVDMVVMAERDEYDCAYLLTADGDFTPAVEAIRATGKRVYAASPGKGAQLAASVNTYIPLKRAWFDDCF
jgi:uncharacterized LabA/DUF88 family protein